ncbi:hypothetical protein H3C65_03330 [Patescibacteria group bacterium]|nr:hypothetical protein [Patescibacteria group bacterium]
MDSFNKVISFVLGLVVVLVFFSVVTGKLKLPGKYSTPFAKKISPTPTTVSTLKDEDKTNQSSTNKKTETSIGNNYKTQPTIKPIKPNSIPATGLPTFFIPSLLAGGLGGAFLRKTGKRS